MVIAIDGPSASGKSSIAKALGIRLGFKFISSGYFYRIITLIAQKFSLSEYDLLSESKILELVSQNDIKFNGVDFLLNGTNVISHILNERIDFQVSLYSSYIGVRNIVNKKLREIVKLKGDNYIIEGRDITTVVFPEAEVKIYLDASVKVRALRRYNQRSDDITLNELEQALERRDEIDQNKEYGKLKLDKEVFYIDTSYKCLDDVCNIIIKTFNLKKSDREVRMENQEDLQENYLKVLEKVELGSSVSGVVINIMKDYVLVDIGYKSEGFIKIDEFETIPSIGDKLDAIVTKVGGELGLVLSVTKLDSLNLQDKIDEYISNRKVLKGKILVELSSGYKVQINENVIGFMPSYLSSKFRDEKLKRGLVVEFYVIQADKTGGGLRLILDRRTLERERELLKKKELISSYNEGDIVDGVVERITDYSAIVKVKNLVLGVLHKRNIAFNRVENIEDFIRVGDKLRLKIIKLNVNAVKMELSLKALKTNPWDFVEAKYKVESIVKGKVVKILPFGAVVELDSEISGFIHISNFSWVRVIKSPQELVKVGQIVEVKILEIVKENQKISLGIKQVNENPWNNLAQRCAVGKVVQGVVKNITKTGAFVSIEEGIDAYISKFDISWIEEVNPEEYFKLGSSISGKVIELDAKKQNIKLGIKQLEENPWDDFSKSYKKGDALEVEIVEKKSKGLQVRVYGKIMGFISKIQLGDTKESSLEAFENLNVGDKLKVIITNIDFKNKLVLLSYRAYKEQKSSEEISSYLFKEDDEESYKPFANLLKRNTDV